MKLDDTDEPPEMVCVNCGRRSLTRKPEPLVSKVTCAGMGAPVAVGSLRAKQVHGLTRAYDWCGRCSVCFKVLDIWGKPLTVPRHYPPLDIEPLKAQYEDDLANMPKP